MPLHFVYPFEPAPSLAIYEQMEASPSEPDSDAVSAALPAGMLPIALRWKWTPQMAVIVFTGPFWGVLTDRERDTVWNRWGVPIFEYRLDASGKVIAEE